MSQALPPFGGTGSAKPGAPSVSPVPLRKPLAFPCCLRVTSSLEGSPSGTGGILARHGLYVSRRRGVVRRSHDRLSSQRNIAGSQFMRQRSARRAASRHLSAAGRHEDWGSGSSSHDIYIAIVSSPAVAHRDGFYVPTASGERTSDEAGGEQAAVWARPGPVPPAVGSRRVRRHRRVLRRRASRSGRDQWAVALHAGHQRPGQPGAAPGTTLNNCRGFTTGGREGTASTSRRSRTGCGRPRPLSCERRHRADATPTSAIIRSISDSALASAVDAACRRAAHTVGAHTAARSRPLVGHACISGVSSASGSLIFAVGFSASRPKLALAVNPELSS